MHSDSAAAPHPVLPIIMDKKRKSVFSSHHGDSVLTRTKVNTPPRNETLASADFGLEKPSSS